MQKLEGRRRGSSLPATPFMQCLLELQPHHPTSCTNTVELLLGYLHSQVHAATNALAWSELLAYAAMSVPGRMLFLVPSLSTTPRATTKLCTRIGPTLSAATRPAKLSFHPRHLDSWFIWVYVVACRMTLHDLDACMLEVAVTTSCNLAQKKARGQPPVF